MRALRSNDNNRTTNTSSVGTSEVNRASNGLASDAEKRKRLIMRVQFALLDRGFYNGNIDGIMGPSTRLSVKNYRIANGLPIPATETLDTQLLNSLNILVSTTDEKWLFRNLGGDFHASGLITLCLSSSNPARPYIWRFSIFRRFT